MELRRERASWTSFHASSGPCLVNRWKSRMLGAEQAGPDSGPPAFDDSVSEPETNKGDGGAYALEGSERGRPEVINPSSVYRGSGWEKS